MKCADRLSALIQRFRIDAKVHAPDEARLQADAWGTAAPNLFILRRGRLRFDGAAIPDLDAVGNSLAFLPRGAPKGLRVHAEPADAEFVCATVDTGGEANPIERALPDLVSVSLSQSPGLRAVTDILLEEALAPRCGGGAVIDRLCEVVVIRLLRGAIEAGQTQSGLLAGLAHPKLSLAIVAMHDNPERAWRLEDLAEIAGMSRTHFATSFRSVVGVTPGGYLSGWRLTVARMEIAKGTPLKVVAGHVGFSGAAALSRAYARRYGVSPRQWNRAERPALLS